MNLLKHLFGPSTDEIWRQLSEQIGATFVEGDWRPGGKNPD